MVGPRGVFVMVDCAAHHDPSEGLAAILASRQGVMALGPQRDLLFRIRDHVTIAIAALGAPVKLDVALPLSRLAQFVGWLDDTVSTVARGSRLIVFGHLAEGNLHVNVLGAEERAAAITGTVLSSVIALGGAISAEHGIGVAKASWLRRAKGDAAVDAVLAVRRALDPAGLFNPGVLTP
jgi:FAD/FMN-containing dehydrogenase